MTGDDVLPPQIWAGTDNDDVLTSLGIDRFLVERFKSIRLPKFIHPLPYVQRVARRAMEVGHSEAMRATREQPGPIAKDFDNLATLAGEAASALDKLIKHLDPHSARAADLALPILTAQAGHQEGSAQELHLQAGKDAAILLAARKIAQRLEEAAQKKDARIRTRVSGKGARTLASRIMPRLCGRLPRHGFTLQSASRAQPRIILRTRSFSFPHLLGPMSSAQRVNRPHRNLPAPCGNCRTGAPFNYRNSSRRAPPGSEALLTKFSKQGGSLFFPAIARSYIPSNAPIFGNATREISNERT